MLNITPISPQSTIYLLFVYYISLFYFDFALSKFIWGSDVYKIGSVLWSSYFLIPTIKRVHSTSHFLNNKSLYFNCVDNITILLRLPWALHD